MARHACGVTRSFSPFFCWSIKICLRTFGSPQVPCGSLLFPLSFARPKERGKEKGGSGELLSLEIYVRAGARRVTYAAKAAPTQLAFGIAMPSLICYGPELMPASSAFGGLYPEPEEAYSKKGQRTIWLLAKKAPLELF